MKIGRMRLDNKSLFVGMGAMSLLLVLPLISEPIAKVLKSIRDKISSMTKKA